MKLFSYLFSIFYTFGICEVKSKIYSIPESSPKSLKDHLIETHGESDGDRVRCRVSEDCQFFDRREEFVEHMSKSHSDSDKLSNGRRLFCDFPQCFFVTEKSFNLSQHLRTHNDERSFAW